MLPHPGQMPAWRILDSMALGTFPWIWPLPRTLPEIVCRSWGLSHACGSHGNTPLAAILLPVSTSLPLVLPHPGQMPVPPTSRPQDTFLLNLASPGPNFATGSRIGTLDPTRRSCKPTSPEQWGRQTEAAGSPGRCKRSMSRGCRPKAVAAIARMSR